MLTKTKKQTIIKDLTDKFRRQKIAVFTDFRGINVAKLTALRREIKKAGAELKVAKKTFLRLALKAVGLDYDPKELEGEIGVVFGYEDQIAPVKSLAKFIKEKENKTFRILKGLMEGKWFSGEETMGLAKLPGREQLLGKLAWVLNYPMQGFHNVLQANLKNLVVVLSKINENKK